ncbi:MAG: acyltransferase family protein [Candidatus Coprovivens sp.]
MQNKKSIMFIASLLILIYHLWINVSTSIIEMYLRYICIIGVDLFFFISAYNIGNRDIKYKDFIINRIVNIYVKFIIFVIIMAMLKGWEIKKIITIILGIDLFTNGGGSFLWFIPGVMIIYLLLPLYKIVDNKYSKIVPIIAIVSYLSLAIGISYNFYYDEIFILLNRFPIILIGYYIGKYNIINKLNNNKIIYWLLSFILIIVGVIISYYCFNNKIYIDWYYDVIYLFLIPLVLGLILLFDKIKVNNILNKLGSITLELYALQFIIGFSLANYMFMKIGNSLVTNVLVIIILIFISLLIKYIFDFIYNIIVQKK